jgi:hypothetical protein
MSDPRNVYTGTLILESTDFESAVKYELTLRPLSGIIFKLT